MLLNNEKIISSVDNPITIKVENYDKIEIKNNDNKVTRIYLDFREAYPDLFELKSKEKLVLDISDFACRIYSKDILNIKYGNGKIAADAVYIDHLGQVWVRKDKIFQLVFNNRTPFNF